LSSSQKFWMIRLLTPLLSVGPSPSGKSMPTPRPPRLHLVIHHESLLLPLSPLHLLSHLIHSPRALKHHQIGNLLLRYHHPRRENLLAPSNLCRSTLGYGRQNQREIYSPLLIRHILNPSTFSPWVNPQTTNHLTKPSDQCPRR